MRKLTICGTAAFVVLVGAGHLAAASPAAPEDLPPCPIRLVTEIQDILDASCVAEGAHHAQFTSLDCVDGVANFTWECVSQ